MHVKDPVVHVRLSLVDYGSSKRPSMHLEYDNNGQMLDQWSLMEAEEEDYTPPVQWNSHLFEGLLRLHLYQFSFVNLFLNSSWFVCLFHCLTSS